MKEGNNMKHLTQSDLVLINGYLEHAKQTIIRDSEPESEISTISTKLINELQNKIADEIFAMMDHRRIPE